MTFKGSHRAEAETERAEMIARLEGKQKNAVLLRQILGDTVQEQTEAEHEHVYVSDTQEKTQMLYAERQAWR